MKVGWLADDPGYLGGAELTMAEFEAAAPEGVDIVDCPAGEVVPFLDRYVVGNCMTYTELDEMQITGDVIRYHHDINTAPLDEFIDATHIFCSPSQRARMDMDGECIPPAIDLAPFRAVANQNHRKGAVCIGRMAYGKGYERLAEYPEPVDVYSSVEVASEGNAYYKGFTADVAETLASYERFVFLPTAFEPFGRAVVEAWAAGLTLVTNRNVGAMYWIADHQEKLHTAAQDFWEVVTG